MISNTASSKLEPPINVITENVICDDKLLVILTVPRGENKPYAANKTDYWVKVGADKRRATREELRCLMQASGSVYADEMSIPATSIDDIDMFFFKEFYAMKDIWIFGDGYKIFTEYYIYGIIIAIYLCKGM
jgi:ATP-dependent DNA helicase RecG